MNIIKWFKGRSDIEILLIILTAIVIFLSCSGFYEDYRNTKYYGGIDLRTRVVGARLLNSEYSPSIFKWREGVPDKLLDPNDLPEWKYNKIVHPPSILLFQSLIAGLDYKDIRIIWFFFQYFCLFYIIFAFVRLAETVTKKYLVIIVGLLYTVLSSSWHLHVERGQIYIFYAFLLTVSYQLYNKPFLIFHEFISGIVLGVGAWLRPQLSLILIPFAINRRNKFVIGALFGILMGVSVTLLLNQGRDWKDYFDSMKSRIKIREGRVHVFINSDVQYPKAVEGMDNLTDWARFRHVNTSVNSLLFFQFHLNLNLGQQLTLFTILILMILLLFNKRIFTRDMNFLFLLGFLFALISEYFILFPRYPYNDVQWVFPLLIMMLKSDEINNIVLAFLSMGLVLINHWMSWLRYDLLLGQVCLILAVFFFLRISKSRPQFLDKEK